MKGKTICKTLGLVLLALLILVVLYVVYVFASYHRIGDQSLSVMHCSSRDAVPMEDAVETGAVYRVSSANAGFGAYSADYSFFMDGGKASRARSKEAVYENVGGAMSTVQEAAPDFVLLQEVDVDGTRSYHVDEYSILKDTIPSYNTVFAQNYDSAFLFYPFTQPHGRSRSGLALFSKYPVTDSLRRSFPISTSFSKFFDLDRCYSISKVPVDNGKKLVIFLLHMSAYGNSDAIREAQIRMLSADMEKEYEAGNYVLCGGDFNHDLKASEKNAENCESWAYPFPREELPEHFSFCLDNLSDSEKDALWDSARNADMEYVPGVTYTVTLDGFITSDNIECTEYENVNTGYSYSDHDPVYMKFKLLDE